MESHEEAIQEMIARNKEQEAKEQAKLRIKQMELQRKESMKGQKRMGGMGPMPGMGSSGMGMGSSPSYSAPPPSNYSPPAQVCLYLLYVSSSSIRC